MKLTFFQLCGWRNCNVKQIFVAYMFIFCSHDYTIIHDNVPETGCYIFHVKTNLKKQTSFVVSYFLSSCKELYVMLYTSTVVTKVGSFLSGVILVSPNLLPQAKKYFYWAQLTLANRNQRI